MQLEISDFLPRHTDDFDALAKDLKIGNESALVKLRKIYALTDILLDEADTFLRNMTGAQHS